MPISAFEPVDPIALAARLMALESTSGSESAVIALVATLLGERGWHVRRIPVSAGRDDVLATAEPDVRRGPLVTLSTHLDTVPPHVPPRIDGDILYGRGACDAKGIAASMLAAAERLRAAGRPVALLFVVGEEVTHDGAHAANEFAKSYFAHDGARRVLLNGEPTEGTLAVGTKGAMRVIVRTAGRAAHSAYPHLGHSATHALVHLLAELDTLVLPVDPLLGETTINIGMLEGGVADNVLAPAAAARLMVRLVTPASDVWRLLDRWATGRATLEAGPTVPAVRLTTYPGFETSVAAFATDIPELGAWGTPHLYGPGSIHVAHTLDEHVTRDALRRAVDAYVGLAELALERAPTPIGE